MPTKMLTGRAFCVRSAAKMSPTFHKTTHIPHHGANVRTLRVAAIQQLNYCCGTSGGGRMLNAGHYHGTDGGRYNNGRRICIEGSASPLHRQCVRPRDSNSTYIRSTISKASTSGHFVRTMATINNGNGANDKDARARLTALRLYRILQRFCERLVPTNEGAIFLQNDISASDWGHYHFHDNGDIENSISENETEELIRLFLVLSGADPVSGISKENDWHDELMNLLPNVANKNTYSKTCWTTPANLREALRFAFRSSSSLSSQSPLELQGLALRAIQILEEQVKLWNQSSVSNTSNGLVRVMATSRCLGTVSPVAMNASYSQLTPKYRFAYRIRVENVSSSTTVQLLGRYWHIAEEHDDSAEDENIAEPIEVDAPYTGAVGQLPVLHPGQVFEYVSGTDLTTPRGEMMGHLYMATVPPQTRSAKSGDNVTAVTNQGSKASSPPSSSDSTSAGDDSNQTTLFQAPVKPFRLESFEQ